MAHAHVRRRRTHVLVAVGLAALLVGGFASAPLALAWLRIPDPGPAERRAMADRVVGATSALAVLDAEGRSEVLSTRAIAELSTGACLRETSLEFAGMSARRVLGDARVTHLCRLDLVDTGGHRYATALRRQRWLFSVPPGQHENPVPAEPFELRAVLERLAD